MLCSTDSMNVLTHRWGFPLSGVSLGTSRVVHVCSLLGVRHTGQVDYGLLCGAFIEVAGYYPVIITARAWT